MDLPSLVSSFWLFEHLSDASIVVLDATLSKPKSAGEVPYEDLRIPNSQFFDIDGSFSDQTIDLPHMMCNAEQFQREARKLGINHDSKVVIYDKHGVYSAPRAWWMLKSMGLKNVAVLDGGLPGWIESGYEPEKINEENVSSGNIEAHFESRCFVDAAYVMDHLDNSEVVVLDARSTDRFNAIAPEPREGLRGGHIPNSLSLPFTEVIEKHKMKSVEELNRLFKSYDIQGKRLVFSCGSGLTACIILFAAHLVGFEELTVYDGSWSEWGQPSHLPVVSH